MVPLWTSQRVRNGEHMNSRIFTPCAGKATQSSSRWLGFHPRFSHKFYGLIFWTGSWLMCAVSFLYKTTQKLLFCTCLLASKLFFTVENLAYYYFCRAWYGKFWTQVNNQLFPTIPRWMVCTIIHNIILLIKRLVLRSWKRID